MSSTAAPRRTKERRTNQNHPNSKRWHIRCRTTILQCLPTGRRKRCHPCHGRHTIRWTKRQIHHHILAVGYHNKGIRRNKFQQITLEVYHRFIQNWIGTEGTHNRPTDHVRSYQSRVQWKTTQIYLCYSRWNGKSGCSTTGYRQSGCSNEIVGGMDAGRI